MRRAVCAAALIFSACATAPDHPLPPAARASLAIASVDPTAESFDVPFKQGGRSSGMAHIQKLDAVSHSISLSAGNRPPCKLDKEFQGLLTRITAVGTVDVEGRGDEELLVLNEDGGTGSHDEILLLVDPRDCGAAGLDITVMHQATHPVAAQTPLGRFQDLDDLRRRPERRFLNVLKYRYGYLSQDDVERDRSNPRYAYYFWARANGSVTDGPMKIRRCKGPPPSIDSVVQKLADGAVVYTADFKAGVVAYDEAKKEHYVLYHPQDLYHAPSVLKRAGPYLLIGTRGEGVAAVDLRTLSLRRLRFSGSDDDVKSLDIDGGKVYVNGTRELRLPGL